MLFHSSHWSILNVFSNLRFRTSESMKAKYLFFLAAVVMIGFSSCKKKEGCMDANATNYDPEAKVDDGSCIFPIEGCTDPSAINYNPDAEVDDGNCTYADNFTPFSAGNYWTLEDEITILTQTTDVLVEVVQYKDTTFEGYDWMLQRETITAGTFPPQENIYAYRRENSGKVYRRELVTVDSVGVEQLYIDYPLDLGHEWYDTPGEDNFLCKVLSTAILDVPAGTFNNSVGIEYTQLDSGIPSVFYFAKDVGPARIDIDYELPVIGQLTVQAELTDYQVN